MMVCFFTALEASFRNYNLAQGLTNLAQKIIFMALYNFPPSPLRQKRKPNFGFLFTYPICFYPTEAILIFLLVVVGSIRPLLLKRTSFFSVS